MKPLAALLTAIALLAAGAYAWWELTLRNTPVELPPMPPALVEATPPAPPPVTARSTPPPGILLIRDDDLYELQTWKWDAYPQGERHLTTSGDVVHAEWAPAAAGPGSILAALKREAGVLTALLDSQTGAILRELAFVPETRISSRPRDFPISPEGGRILLGSWSTGYEVVSLASGGPGVQVIPPGQDAYNASWSPDGSIVSYMSRDQLWVVPSDGSAAPRMLAANIDTLQSAFGPFSPPATKSAAWNADGSKLFVTSNQDAVRTGVSLGNARIGNVPVNNNLLEIQPATGEAAVVVGPHEVNARLASLGIGPWDRVSISQPQTSGDSQIAFAVTDHRAPHAFGIVQPDGNVDLWPVRMSTVEV